MRAVKYAALVLLLAAVAVGCGATKVKPTLIKVDDAIYQSTKAIHDTAMVLGKAGAITPAQELRLQQAILPVSKLGESATRAIVAWKDGPTPPEVQQLVGALKNLSTEIIAVLPMNDGAKAALLEKVALAQQAVLTILMLMGGAA